VRLPYGGRPEQIGTDGTSIPGDFALPGGLVDCHAHLSIALGDATEPRGSAELVAANHERNRRAGVLWARDAGRVPGSDVGLRGVVSCGRFLAPPGRYHEWLIDEVGDLVADALEQDTPWVKVIADFPGPDGNWLAAPVNYDRDALTELAAAAHDAGKRVAAHVSGELVRDCVAAGIDSIEHGPLIDAESLAVLGERGGAWTPTLATVAGALEQIPPARPVLDGIRAALAAAPGAGVRVLAGGDEVGAGSLHREIATLIRYGMDPADALASASTVARDYLGLPELGVVTFDRDPRADPSALAEPVAVVDQKGNRVL
jgi:imidazolonepropionase-like amidohydrolase